jgi:hypothetical protein
MKVGMRDAKREGRMVKQAWLAGEIFPRRSGFFAFLTATILIAVGIGEAREWSEPIQITNHWREYLGSDYQLELDPRGYFHLAYRVQSYQQQPHNRLFFYFKIDQEGGPISDTLHPRLMNDWNMAIDSSGNAYFLASHSDTGHVFTAFDSAGEVLVEPRELPEIWDNWIGSGMRNDFVNNPILVYSPDGTLIYTTILLKNSGREGEEQFVTYTRLTLDGEVIDSTMVLASYPSMRPDPNWDPRMMHVRVDSERNFRLQRR